MQHLTMDLVNKSLIFIIIDRHIYLPEKLDNIQGSLEKWVQEENYSSKCFNLNYMDSVGYATREKLRWTSVKYGRITNKTSKKGSYKTHINNIYPSKTLGFGCSPHKDTCDILSEDLIL